MIEALLDPRTERETRKAVGEKAHLPREEVTVSTAMIEVETDSSRVSTAA